jgi:hypothetical protein
MDQNYYPYAYFLALLRPLLAISLELGQNHPETTDYIELGVLKPNNSL